MILIKANEATASKRTVAFDLRDATDGLTPELAEEGGQPQIMSDGAAWTNVGIGTLLPAGGAGQGATCAGRYVAVLTQAAVLTAGTIIETRYKSAATVETPGDSVQVVGFNPSAAFAVAGDAMDLVADAVDAAAVATDVVTEIQAGLATSANQTTILNRIGAFTGSGVNTVLGFFKALFRSDASAPSDVGGTFDPTTDSTQAVRDAIAAQILNAALQWGTLDSSNRVLKYVKGDVPQTVTFTVTRNSAVVVITGATCKFYMKRGTATVINGRTCTVSDGPNGQCTLAWESADFATAGQYTGELEVTFSTGKIETVYQRYDISVRDALV